MALTRLRPRPSPRSVRLRSPRNRRSEDPRQLVGGNARPGVADAQDRVRRLAAQLDVDAPAGGRVLDRVVDQVRGDLFEARAIGR